jgi:hypothetical protein
VLILPAVWRSCLQNLDRVVCEVVVHDIWLTRHAVEAKDLPVVVKELFPVCWATSTETMLQEVLHHGILDKRNS